MKEAGTGFSVELNLMEEQDRSGKEELDSELSNLLQELQQVFEMLHKLPPQHTGHRAINGVCIMFILSMKKGALYVFDKYIF